MRRREEDHRRCPPALPAPPPCQPQVRNRAVRIEQISPLVVDAPDRRPHLVVVVRGCRRCRGASRRGRRRTSTTSDRSCSGCRRPSRWPPSASRRAARIGRSPDTAGTTSLTLVAATNRPIGSPPAWPSGPPSGCRSCRSASRHDGAAGRVCAELRDGVEVIDHLRQQPPDVDRVGRREAHAAPGAPGRRTRPCVSRWQSSKLPAIA